MKLLLGALLDLRVWELRRFDSQSLMLASSRTAGKDPDIKVGCERATTGCAPFLNEVHSTNHKIFINWGS